MKLNRRNNKWKKYMQNRDGFIWKMYRKQRSEKRDQSDKIIRRNKMKLLAYVKAIPKKFS